MEHDRIGWADAIGTLSILLGAQSLLDAVSFAYGWGCQSWVVPFYADGHDSWCTSIAIGTGLALIVSGQLLRTRRRAGAVFHVAWAVLMVLIISAVPLSDIVWVSAAIIRGRLTSPSFALCAIGFIAAFALLDAAYPSFLLIWFSRGWVRRQVRSWPTSASPGATQSDLGPSDGIAFGAIVPIGLGLTTFLWALRTVIECFLGPMFPASAEPLRGSWFEWGLLSLGAELWDLRGLAWFPLLAGVPLAIAGIGIYRRRRWAAWVRNACAVSVCLVVFLVTCFEQCFQVPRLWYHVLIHHVVVVVYLASVLCISTAHAIRRSIRRSPPEARNPGRA